MLQTLVENAIKHGISKNTGGGIVSIISDFVDDHHELIVRNTGHLNGTCNNEGFGISSTISRLSLLYGGKATFEIRNSKDKNMVEAVIKMPVYLGEVKSKTGVTHNF
jgi:LytS/YehU family sensor histidine kinase